MTPQDGKNLNRCFPGDPDGTCSDVLAHHVFEQLIRPSDALIDLHGGDMVEALEPFTLYDESPVDARAREMALAFGLPYVTARRPATRSAAQPARRPRRRASPPSRRSAAASASSKSGPWRRTLPG